MLGLVEPSVRQTATEFPLGLMNLRISMLSPFEDTLVIRLRNIDSHKCRRFSTLGSFESRRSKCVQHDYPLLGAFVAGLARLRFTADASRLTQTRRPRAVRTETSGLLSAPEAPIANTPLARDDLAQIPSRHTVRASDLLLTSTSLRD